MILVIVWAFNFGLLLFFKIGLVILFAILRLNLIILENRLIYIIFNTHVIFFFGILFAVQILWLFISISFEFTVNFLFFRILLIILILTFCVTWFCIRFLLLLFFRHGFVINVDGPFTLFIFLWVFRFVSFGLTVHTYILLLVFLTFDLWLLVIKISLSFVVILMLHFIILFDFFFTKINWSLVFFLFLLLLHILHVLVPHLIVQHIIYIVIFIIFIWLLLIRLAFLFTVHIPTEVFLHLKVIIILTLLLFLLLFLLLVIIRFVVFKTFKLFFMFDLICFVFFALTISHSHAILFEIWWWLSFWVIFLFLAAKTLVN